MKELTITIEITENEDSELSEIIEDFVKNKKSINP